MDSHFAQMTEALVRGEIIQVYMILQDNVLINIVNSNREDVIIQGQKQDSVLINIVNSNGEDVIIRGHKQDRAAINIMNSNEEGAITKGHRQDDVLISGKQVTAVISDKVDTIHY